MPWKWSVLLDRISFAGETRLHVACRNGNLVLVTKILESPNVDINSRDNNDWTPLHEAISNGQLQCVNALLNYKTASIKPYFIPSKRSKLICILILNKILYKLYWCFKSNEIRNFQDYQNILIKCRDYHQRKSNQKSTWELLIRSTRSIGPGWTR